MSEYASGVNNRPEQPALPDMELSDIIKNMTPDQRIQEKRRLLSEISDREILCNIIDKVNDAEEINVELIH